MKKVIFLALSVVMFLATLSACTKNSSEQSSNVSSDTIATTETPTSTEVTTETTEPSLSPEEVFYQKKEVPTDQIDFEEIELEIPDRFIDDYQFLGQYGEYVFCCGGPIPDEPISWTMMKFDDSGKLIDQHKMEGEGEVFWRFPLNPCESGLLAMAEISSPDDPKISHSVKVGYIDEDTFEFHELFEKDESYLEEVAYVDWFTCVNGRFYLAKYYTGGTFNGLVCRCYDSSGKILFMTQEFSKADDEIVNWFVQDDTVYAKIQRCDYQEVDGELFDEYSSKHVIRSYTYNGEINVDLSNEMTIDTGSNDIWWFDGTDSGFFLYDDVGRWRLDPITNKWECVYVFEQIPQDSKNRHFCISENGIKFFTVDTQKKCIGLDRN